MGFSKKLLWLIVPVLAVVVVVAVVVPLFLVQNVVTDPEVTTSQGILRGTTVSSHFNRNAYAFKGIPYAQPPVGDLRFRAPIAAGPWDGTLDATQEPSDCVQPPDSGDEDCLYLNVYTPQLPAGENSTLLPVMVFIHGGAFRAGSNDAAEYGPDYLLGKDVVLVVPSYRLGMLGFLSTGDEVAPGNFGMKDLVKALEWNRDNIAYFGGDPNRVTIFGQSAGSIIVHLMAMSNLTEGLFHQYITESGSALSYDAQRPKELFTERAFTVGEYVGCPTNTSTDLVNCLRGVNTSTLISTDSIFKVWGTLPNVIWSPTIEPEIEGAFITESPLVLLDSGRVRDMPWLSTCNKDEGINHASRFLGQDELFEDFLANLDVLLPLWITYDLKVENATAYTDALKSYYLNDLTADRDILLSNFTLLMSDALCRFPTYNSNKKQLVYATQPQYLGSFEYRGALTYSNFEGETEVAHGDELIYLFPLGYDDLSSTGAERTGTDMQMVNTMIELWASFATNGIPSTTWEQHSSLNNYLRIGNYSDTAVGLQYNWLGERLQFWEELTAATTWL